MSSRLLFSLSALLLASTTVAQNTLPKNDLSVAFVGDADTPRTRAFVRFLGDRFREVEAHDRNACDPVELGKVDVVVLDWDQKSGINNWTRWAEERQEPSSPLGERADWKAPTVLLGSAGLNLASAWSVRGSSG